MEIQEPSEDVIDNGVEQQDASNDVIVEDQVEQQEIKQEPQVDYKNRAYELERKLSNLTKEIPRMIEENLAQAQKPKEQEYTIAQLEAYALENPDHRPWVEEEKEKIREKKFEEKLKATETQRQRELLRQQSENKVLNNPKFKEVFVKDPTTGQVLFNPNSEMAIAMSGYYNDPRLKGQPDALEIASRLAYADFIDQKSSTTSEKMTDLKRKNAQLKQSTMVEGGGVVDATPAKDSYQVAAERLSKTGSRRDAEDAVKEYFRKTRK